MVFQDAYRIAPVTQMSSSPAKSGTGKEVLASFIHAASTQIETAHRWHSTRPQFPNNCWPANSSVTKKGAFTGADYRRGRPLP
jgi:DNA-binding NtrC family response regulator